jgi:hypothetical protein
MLPFLEPKKLVGTVIARRGKRDLPDIKPEVSAPGQESNHAMEAASEALLKAVDERSIKDIASALQQAFDCLEAAEDEDTSGDEEAS